jgi:tetratricopeptide (TPR) repeat protein
VTTVVAVGSLVAIAVRAARDGDRRPLAGLGWFAATFAPASNLLTATPQILTERTLYGPSIAVAFCGALLISVVASQKLVRMPPSAFLRTSAIAVAAILIVATGSRTLRFSVVWRSNEALFRQMIIADPASYRGYWKLAGYAKSRNEFDESLTLYERAYELYPRDRQLLADYAQTLLDRGQPMRAAAIARQLIAWPEVRRMPNVVSLYLAALGRAYGADSVIRAGTDLFAAERVPTAALFVGAAHESRGDSGAAEQSYRAGLHIAPTDTALRRRLALMKKP